MQVQIQNISPNTDSFQNQKLFHVNNFQKHVVVTSLLNNIKKSLNNKKTNAFSRMSNKSFMKDTQQRDCKPIQI